MHLLGVPKLLRLYKGNQLTILSLHRISDEEDYFFDPIKPLAFEKLVKYVLKHYTVISFSDLAEIKKPSAKPLLILSFDDGYYDFYEHALPILDKYKLASNHNIVNDCANTNAIIWTQRLNYIFNHCRENNIKPDFGINDLDCAEFGSDTFWIKYYLKVFKRLLQLPKTERMKPIIEKENRLSLAPKYRMMGWKEIVECSKHRVEIGSHTYTHDVVSTIADKETLEFELVKSKNETEERVGKPVDILALPNGRGNEAVNEIVRRVGYKYLLCNNEITDSIFAAGNEELNVFDRVELLNEPFSEMVLRSELFHARMRKYV